MTESQYFVAYKVRSLDEKLVGQEDKYFSGIWLQRKNGKPDGYWKAKPCQALWDKDDVSNMFWQ